LNFFDRHPKDCHYPMVARIFLVTTTRLFQKHMTRPLFVATKKFRSPQGRVIKNILVTAVFTTKNCLVATKGTNQISSITHPCGDIKIFNHHRGVTKMGQGVATRIFWSPSYHHYFPNGDQIVLVATKGGCHIFWKILVENHRKVLKKMSGMPPFMAIEKTLVTIQEIMTIGW
jgi:hypothetical protein